MAHIKLNSQIRTIQGNQCRKLRRSGQIPAIVFGEKSDSEMIQVEAKNFYKIYKESGRTNVIDLKIGDAKSLPVIVHGLDIDPIHSLARHIDFMVVNLKQKTHIQVPLVFIGDPVGVKEQGGVLVTSLDHIDVEALPDEMPSEIEVNVESLAQIGDSILVSDLALSDKYTILNESTLTIATLTAQSTEEDFASAEVVEEVTEESQEGSEGSNKKENKE